MNILKIIYLTAFGMIFRDFGFRRHLKSNFLEKNDLWSTTVFHKDLDGHSKCEYENN